jgi:uracil-DNA glycosylase family 4
VKNGVPGRDSLAAVTREIIACAACPRLRRHCRDVARRGKPEFTGWTYWGKPVPGFGDPRAEVLIVGLAPAAHGGNRTGRMFTGDGSAAWLVQAMYDAGFASQPVSSHRGDGLTLHGAYLTAPVRCAPPANKPAPEEIARCTPFLEREIALLPRVRVIIALGRIAFDVCRRLLRHRGADLRGAHFAHGAAYDLGPGHPALLASYHPSRQNTNTGKLTREMLTGVFRAARQMLDGAPGAAIVAYSGNARVETRRDGRA